MTTFNENDRVNPSGFTGRDGFDPSQHPRAGSGQFTAKAGSEPDVRLLPDIQAPDISELAEMTPEQHRAIAQHNFNFNREFQGSDVKAAEFASAAIPRPRGVAGRGHWAYRSYQGEVANVFGEALREEHSGISVTDEEHKRLFDKAWDYGHDSGFYGVEQEYINLVTSDGETEGTE